MLRPIALVLCCCLAPGALAQDQPTPAAPMDNTAGGPEAIGRRIFDALNRHRESNNVPAAMFSPRIYIALQDHLDLLVKRGYRGGPPKKKGYPKLTERARERHGWSLSLMDNYSNGKKDGMNPDEIIRILQTNPDIRSLLRKDLNCGAAAAAPVPDSDDYVIVVALTRGTKKDTKNLPGIAALDKEWPQAEADKRKSMVKGLAGLKDPETLLALTRAVDDPDVAVRTEAIKALGKLGDCWPVPALMDRLEKDENEDVKTECQKALELISGKKDYDDVRKWRVWWSVERDIFVRRK